MPNLTEQQLAELERLAKEMLQISDSLSAADREVRERLREDYAAAEFRLQEILEPEVVLAWVAEVRAGRALRCDTCEKPLETSDVVICDQCFSENIDGG